MTFKEKVLHLMDIKGVNNRDLAIKFGVSEPLISKWINKDEPSLGFINHLVNIWPDIDLNYLMKNNQSENYLPIYNSNLIEEKKDGYGHSDLKLIEEIEERLIQLKQKVAQNSHNRNIHS